MPARISTRLALCAVILAFSYPIGAQTAPTPTLQDEFGDEIAHFIEADRLAPPAACQVLFVGSSSIVKWKETLTADMAPLPVINRGFGGSHIEHVNRWFDQIVAAYHPRAIVFYAGENDIDAGNPVESVVSDFDEFMKRKTLALADTPVYFISLKPSKLRFAEFPKQGLVNQAIRDRAEQRTDLHYIDVVSAMLDKDGKLQDLYVDDGLHMNAKGYEIWTRAVRAALIPNTEGEARRCHARLDGAPTR